MHQNDEMPVYPAMQPATAEGMVQIVAVRLEALHNDVSVMRDVLKELASAVTKLAVIEERQGQTNQALERAFTLLEKLETRVSSIERAQPLQQQTTDWVTRGVWAVVVVVALFAAKKVGLM